MTTTDSPPTWHTVIVGGGAAGLSAALILARARRRVLVLDGGEPRNRFAPHMHGVLGRDGSSPLDLVADGRREVRAADGVVETARVATITALEPGFELVTEGGESIRAARVIVATGLRDDLPRVPGLAEQWGRGVVACPYCDGYEAREKHIGVLPGSLAGLHKAQMLRSYSSRITVLGALVGGIPEEELRSLTARGISVDDRPVARVLSEGDRVTGVEFADGTVLPIDVLFVDPAMSPLDGLLRRLEVERMDTPAGPWTRTDATQQTSVPGLYAVGNVATPWALVPIAMAEGVAAAVAINAELVLEEVAAALAAADVVDAELAS
jgi:thioredoxin reductase